MTCFIYKKCSKTKYTIAEIFVMLRKIKGDFHTLFQEWNLHLEPKANNKFTLSVICIISMVTVTLCPLLRSNVIQHWTLDTMQS